MAQTALEPDQECWCPEPTEEGFIRYDQFYELLYPKAEEGDEQIALDGSRPPSVSARRICTRRAR